MYIQCLHFHFTCAVYLMYMCISFVNGYMVCIVNTCSFENYHLPDKEHPYIDVWPLCVQFNQDFDDTFTLLLQLACVLHMKDKDKLHKSYSKVRIFIVVESESQF